MEIRTQRSVDVSLDEKLKELRSKYGMLMREECLSLESEHYGFKNVQVLFDSHQKLSTTYVVDDYRMSYSKDQYSNMSCEFNILPTVEVFNVFADKIHRSEQIGKQRGYRDRAVQGIFIALAKQFGRQMTGKELYEVLRLSDKFPVERNDRSRHGFRSWLLTRSYSCDDNGQFSAAGTFGQWLGKIDFFDLLDGDQDIKVLGGTVRENSKG